MVEKASYNYERSINDVEAFQIGLQGDTASAGEWSYVAKGGAITGICIINNGPYCLGSLILQSVDDKGTIQYSQSFGGGSTKSDNPVHKIMLDWPQEYFTLLSGTTYNDPSNDHFWIASLNLETNKRKFGPYGSEVTANKFEFPLKDRVIVGFYGRAQPHYAIIRGLGVYVKPSSEFFGSSTSPLPITPKFQFGGPYEEEECIKIQPWGWTSSLENEQWSYMLKSRPTTIKIVYSKYIHSISFQSSYESNEFKYSEKSSDDTYTKQESFYIRFPDEFFISIEATTSNMGIGSICLFTNKTIYGPYGSGYGHRFKFHMEGGVIVGFHGTVGNFFQSLGVYVKQLS